MTERRSVKGVAQRISREEKKLMKDAAVRTADSMQNLVAKLGIGTDNVASYGTYGFNPITRVRTLLEWIHRGSWIGGVAIDVVADDMTRAGVSLEGELKPDQIDAMEESATTFNIWNDINDTVKWARLYGGSVAALMIEGQDPKTPFRLESVGKGQFQGLLVLDRWMVEPSMSDLVQDPGPHLGTPKYYRIVADAPALPGMTIHHSRCLRLEGVRLPYWQRLMENMWGMSVMERLYDRLLAFDSATQGAAQLVYKAFIRTYKLENFRELVSSGGDALNQVAKFVEAMRRFQSVEGITLLDTKDEFETGGFTGFSGLADALLQFGQQLSGALGIPLVRLFGQSPAGLNSTGESDLRTYYDTILNQQNARLKVPVTTIYRAIARSEGIKLPEGFAVKFNPLWQLTDKEKADIASSITATVSAAEEGGLIDRSTALKELRQSSRITGIWSNISDEDIQEAELEPAPESMNVPAPGEEEQGRQGEEKEQMGEEAEATGAEKTPPMAKGARPSSTKATQLSKSAGKQGNPFGGKDSNLRRVL